MWLTRNLCVSSISMLTEAKFACTNAPCFDSHQFILPFVGLQTHAALAGYWMIYTKASIRATYLPAGRRNDPYLAAVAPCKCPLQSPDPSETWIVNPIVSLAMHVSSKSWRLVQKYYSASRRTTLVRQSSLMHREVPSEWIQHTQSFFELACELRWYVVIQFNAWESI